MLLLSQRLAMSAKAALLGLCLMSLGPTPTNAQTARGLDNPTLALNLAPVRDFAPGRQFIDLARMMRPWRAIIKGQNHSKGMKWEELKAGGYLDTKGWPTKIPQGYEELWSVLQWTSLPQEAERSKGRYVLTYDGTGTLGLKGDAQIVQQEPGRIVFDNQRGGAIQFRITQTDPAGTGDHIRNISLVAERHLDLHAAGAIFNPDWVRLIADARQIRFRNWQPANNSTEITWSDRATPGSANNFSVPLEYMVRLTNEVGAEPW